jgi:parallel beta-helix repeat protein
MFAQRCSLYNSYSKIPLIISSLLIILLTFGLVDAEVITVCNDGCDYSTIGLGIYHARPGDIVEVQSGVYIENVIANKPMVVRGVDTGSGKPMVNGNYNESGFIIEADGVTLEGFEINNSKGSYFDLWAGIRVESDNNIIANNTIYASENGILINSSGQNVIENNVLADNKYGIKLDASSNNSILNNTLRKNKFGILFAGSKNNELKGNDVSSSDSIGIKLDSSLDNILKDNQMRNNTYNFAASGRNDIDKSNLVNFRSVYYLVGKSNQILDASSAAGAVCCIDCKNMTFKDLTLNNNLNGIYLLNTGKSTIENCSIDRSECGIKLEGSEGNTLLNNTVFNSTFGISLINCTNDLISGNCIQENGGAGLNLELSREANIEDNLFSRNMQGIIIKESDDNLIRCNNLSNNTGRGIFLSKSLGNKISRNRIVGNNFGMELEKPWKTRVSGNEIMENGIGLILECGINNDISANNITSNLLGLSLDRSGNNSVNNSLQYNIKDEEELPPCSQTTKASMTSTPGIEVIIKSDPDGAEARINGDYVGDTTTTAYLERGKHVLKLELDGYYTNKSNISIPGPKEVMVELIEKVK